MIYMEPEEIRTLRVKDSTHKKLIKLGMYGESMDDIINRLLFQERTKSAQKKAGYEGRL